MMVTPFEKFQHQRYAESESSAINDVPDFVAPNVLALIREKMKMRMSATLTT